MADDKKTKKQLDDEINAVFAKAMEADVPVEGNYEVPQSFIPKTFQDSFDSRLNETLNASGSGVGKSTATIVKHYGEDSQYKAMEAALQVIDEAPRGASSNYSHEGTVIQMPGDVLARPSRLYWVTDDKGQRFYKRGSADAILKALLGQKSELEDRVYESAARCGFNKNPLVYVAQKLYHELTCNDNGHDYAAYAKETDDRGFDEDQDENSRSPFIMGLNKCFYGRTVKDLCRLAKFKNVSILCILRCIMCDVATERGVVKGFRTPQAAA